jgi:hypothetical protein
VSTPPSECVTTIEFGPFTNGTDDATPDTNDPDATPVDHDADPDANVTVNPVDDTDRPTVVPVN